MVILLTSGLTGKDFTILSWALREMSNIASIKTAVLKPQCGNGQKCGDYLRDKIFWMEAGLEGRVFRGQGRRLG